MFFPENPAKIIAPVITAGVTYLFDRHRSMQQKPPCKRHPQTGYIAERAFSAVFFEKVVETTLAALAETGNIPDRYTAGEVLR